MFAQLPGFSVPQMVAVIGQMSCAAISDISILFLVHLIGSALTCWGPPEQRTFIGTKRREIELIFGEQIDEKLANSGARVPAKRQWPNGQTENWLPAPGQAHTRPVRALHMWRVISAGDHWYDMRIFMMCIKCNLSRVSKQLTKKFRFLQLTADSRCGEMCVWLWTGYTRTQPSPINSIVTACYYCLVHCWFRFISGVSAFYYLIGFSLLNNPEHYTLNPCISLTDTVLLRPLWVFNHPPNVKNLFFYQVSHGLAVLVWFRSCLPWNGIWLEKNVDNTY